MTINELHIQLDLQPENRIDILNVARKCDEGYLFVDSNDGHCYLFDKNGNEDDIKKIKNIRNYAFLKCKNLKSIVIPDSVKSIGDGAFYECESLTSIIIPDSVEWIGYGVFAYCKSIESIIIPDSVKSIGDGAFWYCESLKSIKIPDSVENIGYYAFYGCESLNSVAFKRKTIDQVKAMENYPFDIENESIIRYI